MKRNHLKEFREQKNLSQQKMADILGISKSHYVNIERGIFDPSFGLMQKFSEVFPDDYEDVWVIFQKGA